MNTNKEQECLEKMLSLAEKVSGEVSTLRERRVRLAIDLLLLGGVVLVLAPATGAVMRVHRDVVVYVSLATLLLPVLVLTIQLAAMWCRETRHISKRIATGREDLNRLLETIHWQNELVCSSSPGVSPIAKEILRTRASRISFNP